MRLPKQSAGVMRATFAISKRAYIVPSQSILRRGRSLGIDHTATGRFLSENNFFKSLNSNTIETKPGIQAIVDGNRIVGLDNSGNSDSIDCSCTKGCDHGEFGCSWIKQDDGSYKCNGGCYAENSVPCVSCAVIENLAFGGRIFRA